MSNLTTFMYDFISKKVNDPNCINWLPHQLKKYELKQEKVIIDSSDINKEISDNLLSLLENIVEFSIPKNDTELIKEFNDNVCLDIDIDKPKLDFYIKNVVVTGLENSKLDSKPNITNDENKNEYKIKTQLYGPAYDSNKYSELTEFNMKFDFFISQSFCAYLKEYYQKNPREYVPASNIHVDKYFKHNWPHCAMELSGSMEVSLSDFSKKKGTLFPLKLNADISYKYITKNKIRLLQADLNSTKLSKDFTDYSEIKINQLTTEYTEFKDSIKDSVQKTILEDPFKIDVLVDIINKTLNKQSMREDLSKKMSNYTAEQFDKVLGVVDGELPTTVQQERNAVDQYIFDRIRYALCSEKSDFCLHKLIENIKNPILDPWSLGTIEVCSINTSNNLDIRNVILDNTIMEGLSKIILKNDDIEFESKINDNFDFVILDTKLDLKISGDLKFTLSGEYVDNCFFSISLNKNSFHVKCIISGDEIDNLLITIKEINVGYDKNAIHITFIDKKGGFFAPFIEDILNQDSIKSTIIDKINQNLAKSMDDISNNATEIARNILNKANKMEE